MPRWCAGADGIDVFREQGLEAVAWNPPAGYPGTSPASPGLRLVEPRFSVQIRQAVATTKNRTDDGHRVLREFVEDG